MIWPETPGNFHKRSHKIPQNRHFAIHFFDIFDMILKKFEKQIKFTKSTKRFKKFKNTEWRFGSNQTTIFRLVYTRKVITITSVMFGCTIVVVLISSFNDVCAPLQFCCTFHLLIKTSVGFFKF